MRGRPLPRRSEGFKKPETNQSGGAATIIAAQGGNPGLEVLLGQNGGAVARLFALGKRFSGNHPGASRHPSLEGNFNRSNFFNRCPFPKTR